jgi:hypothetical protein
MFVASSCENSQRSQLAMLRVGQSQPEPVLLLQQALLGGNQQYVFMLIPVFPAQSYHAARSLPRDAAHSGGLILQPGCGTR